LLWMSSMYFMAVFPSVEWILAAQVGGPSVFSTFSTFPECRVVARQLRRTG
jgi:hypothetical protein